MEDRFISQIRQKTASLPPLSAHLIRGIGDDAAVLTEFGTNSVVTTDLLCDGVDFIVGQTPPRLIGRKALAVNLSDLAAMGAVPHSFVISLLLPQKIECSPQLTPEILAEELYQGIIPLAEQFNISLAGGDTNSWPGKLAISITAIGTVSASQTLLRSGAKPGDRILVTGSLGGSIFKRQFHFTPRILEALYLNQFYKIHAAMDISDGLLLDLSRMAKASRTGFILDDASIPIHCDALTPPPNAEAFPGWSTPKSPLGHALGDGEDFELILAVPPEESKRLIKDQPFLDRGKNQAIRKICERNHFSFNDMDFSKPVRLTEIGEWTSPESGMFRRPKDSASLLPITQPEGWTYAF